MPVIADFRAVGRRRTLPERASKSACEWSTPVLRLKRSFVTYSDRYRHGGLRHLENCNELATTPIITRMSRIYAIAIAMAALTHVASAQLAPTVTKTFDPNDVGWVRQRS